jgi:hypothetical protein
VGIEGKVIERFAAAGVSPQKISFARDTFTFNFPGKPPEFVAAFKQYYGPTMTAFEGGEATSIPATYLRVTVAA